MSLLPCLCLSVAVSLVTVLASSSTSCPQGAVYDPHLRKCYVFFPVPLPNSNTSDPADTCAAIGGQLLTVHSAFENAEIRVNAARLLDSPVFWLGMGMLDNGTWIWMDMSPLDYTHWAPGEPSDIDECAVMTVETGLWHSNNCKQDLAYVCQIQL